MIDIAKVAVGLFLFLVLAPAYGYICSRRPKLIRTNLVILAFCTSMPMYRWTFQIASVEWYRGHTRGFEVNLLVALAISSLIGLQLNRKSRVRFWAPGTVVYAAYVLLATISIVNAIDASFVLMATFKFGFLALVYIGVFNSIRGMDDIRALQNAIAAALILQLIVCLKYKYLDGVYRVQGFFPHSNNLGMYAYMTGLYLLGAVLQAKASFKRLALLSLGYLSGMALAFITISRASFAASVVGSGMVIALSVAIRPGVKKIALASLLLVPMAVGVAVVLDQILVRAGGSLANTDGVGSFRAILENQAKAMLSDEPFGIGWNNFCLANSRPWGAYSYIFENYILDVHGYQLSPELASDNPLIESLYWLVLGESGYMAFGAFMLFLWLLLWYVLRSVLFYRTHELGASPLALCVVLSILYLHGYVERILMDTSVLVMFLVLAAVGARLYSWRAQIMRGELSFQGLEAHGRPSLR